MAASKSTLKLELFVAIERGDQKELSEIIERYPEFVNLRASNMWTPILFAARFGHVELVKILAQKGAKLEDRNPIQVACYGAH
jgi:ankyrin repeat protein